MKQAWDDSLPHVQLLVGRVFYAVREDVALLGVAVQVDEKQHLATGASGPKHRDGSTIMAVTVG